MTLVSLRLLRCLVVGLCAGTVLHDQLEHMVAKFVGKPAAITFNMGYMTNASAIPALMGKVQRLTAAYAVCVQVQPLPCRLHLHMSHTPLQGGLIVSDANNHTSIVNGARASGAAIRVFKHNGAWPCLSLFAAAAAAIATVGVAKGGNLTTEVVRCGVSRCGKLGGCAACCHL